jgi:hypothetical protein
MYPYVERLTKDKLAEEEAKLEEVCKDNKDSQECKDQQAIVDALKAKLNELKELTAGALKEAGVGSNFIYGILNMSIKGGSPLGCDDFIFFDEGQENAYDLIKTSLTIFQIIGPILALIFGILDFAKATLSYDNDAMKKASTDFAKRLIAAVILVILPIVLKIILNMAVANGILGKSLPKCF